MATIQSTIIFPSRKRTSYRSKEKKCEKENNFTKPPRASKFPSTDKASDHVLFENESSPPKIRKNAETENLSAEPEDRVIERTTSMRDENSDVDGLTEAIRVLHSSQPVQLYGREDKVSTLSTVLTEAHQLRKSSTLYISGPPGTGKTASINHILTLPEIRDHFKTAYVNCTGLKSPGAALKRIAEGLDLKIESTEKKIQMSIEKYLQSNKKMLLLVLDEMDQLESRKQSLLYTLFEWPDLFRSSLVLLGIANALDLTDRLLPRLQTKLNISPTLIHFPPYSRDEIISILTNRLKEAGVDEVLSGDALQLLARKVDSVSGDIRKALDIARRVIELAQSKSDGDKQVSLKDVLTVVNNVYGTSSMLDDPTSGESFPLHQKILICTMVLIKKNSKVKEMTIGRVHDVYKKVCTKRNLASLDFSEFMSLMELVESRGVLKIIGKTRNRLCKIILLWDEEEISNALLDKQFIASIFGDISCLK